MPHLKSLYYRQSISNLCYWVAAVAIGVTPAIVATDFGGVLPWTKQVTALALAGACGIAIVARLLSIGCPTEVRLPPRSFGVAAVLLTLTTYAALQTLPLPSSMVAWLSPASYAAHVTWAGQILADQSSESIPISIAAFDSRHSIACLVIAIMVSFSAVTIFHDRSRIIWLLSAIAGTAC
ncbi:MAG: hypothetical protein KDB00_14500, partial [Planctomycetales bacterium]|nr:hypothetical protein [Planctomycetales bacterium]